MRTALPHCLLLAGLLAVSAPATADEITDRQKKAVAEKLKRADVANAVTVETDHFLVCTTLPEEKAKALGAVLEKVYTTARKPLQFDDKDGPWKGKLAVFFLPERKDYTLFLRVVAGERTDDGYFIAVRGDEPYVVEGVELGVKAAEADLFAEVGTVVGAAMFQAKGGMTEFPEWVRMGFGRAASLRSEGPNSRRLGAYKAQARTAAVGGKGRPPATVADLWGTAARPDREVIGTSVMDYAAFGPGSANFLKFLNGYRPGEDGQPRTPAQAIEAAGWKVETLDPAWRKWITGGMAVK